MMIKALKFFFVLAALYLVYSYVPYGALLVGLFNIYVLWNFVNE